MSKVEHRRISAHKNYQICKRFKEDKTMFEEYKTSFSNNGGKKKKRN